MGIDLTMTDKKFIEEAKYKVLEELRNTVFVNALEDIQMVWYCYLAGNYKAMFCVPSLPDYYEVTYIKDEDKFIVDTYVPPLS